MNKLSGKSLAESSSYEESRAESDAASWSNLSIVVINRLTVVSNMHCVIFD